MARFVQRRVKVDVNDADLGVVEMLGDPLAINQDLGVGIVFHHLPLSPSRCNPNSQAGGVGFKPVPPLYLPDFARTEKPVPLMALPMSCAARRRPSCYL